MQDEISYLSDGLQCFQLRCHILPILDRVYHREGNPALVAVTYFLWFHKVFCLSWSGFYTIACQTESFRCSFQQF